MMLTSAGQRGDAARCRHLGWWWTNLVNQLLAVSLLEKQGHALRPLDPK